MSPQSPGVLAPPSLLLAFHPDYSSPPFQAGHGGGLGPSRLWRRTGGHPSVPGSISGQTMTKAGGRHLGVYYEWLARAHLNRESISPTQPWSSQGGGFKILACPLVCHCRKVMPLVQLPQTWPSVKVELRTGCWEEVKEATWQSVGLRYLWGSTLSSPVALCPGGNLLSLLPTFLSLGCIYLIWPVLRALWKNEIQTV